MSPLPGNLAALRERSGQALAARLEAGGEAEELTTSPWPELPPGEPLLLIGAAAPAGIRAALDAGRTVWVWDRCAPQLRRLLEAHDWSDALLSDRLRLYCDLDLLTIPVDTPTVVHPALARRFTRELATWAALPTRRALVVAGGLVVEELTRALTERGYGLWTWDTTRLPPAELARIALAFQPTLVVAVNHHPGLPEAIEALGRQLPTLRLAIWEIDPSIDFVRPPAVAVPRTTVHTWRRANVDVYRRAGFRAEWLPLASDPEWRRPVTLTPEERADVAAPVVFVGQSMLNEGQKYRQLVIDRAARARAAAGKDPTEAAALIERVLSAQRASPGTFRIPELLRAHVPELMDLPPGDHEADPVMLAGEAAAAELRLSTVAGLGRHGVHVWGDKGWRVIEAHGARYRGPAGHFHMLPRIYSNGGIHVDIGRLYQLDIVTLRVFDVLACGGFLLAHHGAELEALFTIGEDLETWRTPAELHAKVEHYLAHPDERARIATAGRARLLRDHTIRNRMTHLLGEPTAAQPIGPSPIRR